MESSNREIAMAAFPILRKRQCRRISTEKSLLTPFDHFSRNVRIIRKARKMRRLKLATLAEKDFMAVEAVPCKPLSGSNSLLTGKFTGNFRGRHGSQNGEYPVSIGLFEHLEPCRRNRNRELIRA
jgi:hypothetical protein